MGGRVGLGRQVLCVQCRLECHSTMVLCRPFSSLPASQIHTRGRSEAGPAPQHDPRTSGRVGREGQAIADDAAGVVHLSRHPDCRNLLGLWRKPKQG